VKLVLPLALVVRKRHQDLDISAHNLGGRIAEEALGGGAK